MPRRRSGKKIDFVHWTGFSSHQIAIAAGTFATNTFPAQHDPETLMRMRGEYTASLDGTQVPGASIQISSGLILVPEGTAATVLWSPLTDADAPWIWYDASMLTYEEPVTDVIDIPLMSAVRRVIDNKAMRIIRNQEIQFVVENTTIGTATEASVNVVGRALFGT